MGSECTQALKLTRRGVVVLGTPTPSVGIICAGVHSWGQGGWEGDCLRPRGWVRKKTRASSSLRPAPTHAGGGGGGILLTRAHTVSLPKPSFIRHPHFPSGIISHSGQVRDPHLTWIILPNPRLGGIVAQITNTEICTESLCSDEHLK